MPPIKSAVVRDNKNPMVVMDTSKGKITIELFQDKAPITVKNFLRYVDAKHYDGTIFHRVVADFVIQGGLFDANLKQKATYQPIKNEAGNGLSNKRGTMAMALPTNPDTATAGFYINVKDNPSLIVCAGKDWNAVFGQVADKGSLAVVDAICRVNVPIENVIIRSARRAAKP